MARREPDYDNRTLSGGTEISTMGYIDPETGEYVKGAPLPERLREEAKDERYLSEKRAALLDKEIGTLRGMRQSLEESIAPISGPGAPEWQGKTMYATNRPEVAGKWQGEGKSPIFIAEKPTEAAMAETFGVKDIRKSVGYREPVVPTQPTGPQLESQKIFTGLYTNWMNNNTEGEDHTRINAVEEGVKAREVFKSKYPEPDLYSPQHPAWEKQASAMEKDARDKADYNYKRSNEARKEMWKLAHDKDVRDEVRKTQEENRINAATKAREEGVLKLREEVGKVLQDINNYEATPGERAAYFEGKKKTGDTTIPPTLKLKKAALGDINRRLQSVGMPEMGVETIPEGATTGGRFGTSWGEKKVPTYRVKEGERGAVPQPKPGVRGVAPSTTPLPTPEQAAAELARRRAAKGGR